MTEYLNSKFKSYSPNRLIINEWDNYGADYGLLLVNKEGKWTIYTYADSGYSKSQIIFEGLTEQQLWLLTECMSPTNINYKTSRK